MFRTSLLLLGSDPGSWLKSLERAFKSEASPEILRAKEALQDDRSKGRRVPTSKFSIKETETPN
jgi:hypothetical protein